MIRWSAQMTDTPQAQALILRWAMPQDCDAAARYRQAGARRNSLTARAGLRALLALATGRSDWPILTDARGKPFLENGPAISWSHSRNMAAYTTGDAAALGIDIEMATPRPIAALARHAFGANETAFVDRAGTDGFYKIWTLREAIAKAEGTGLRLAANRTDLLADPDRDGVWQEENRQLFHTWLGAYSVALCVKATAVELTRVHLTGGDPDGFAGTGLETKRAIG